MKTYLFYDTETSGLNPAFDQILTFAAIRTDLSLNEVDRHMVVVRLRPDIVPSPKAFLTHGLTQEDLENGISEYDAALKIHGIVNTPGTMSLGYNTLGFDDEFLRFLFYRNLLDPYTHQYSNGCTRMDILPVTVLYRLFKPDVLKWPEVDGRPSLKLENISKMNNFKISGKAHEAMSDVEAVIALSRKFFEIRESWDYAMDFFNKTRDEVRIAGIKKEMTVGSRQFRICLMVSSSFGPESGYMVPVVELGPSRPYKNQTLWLRLDRVDILGIKENLDVEALFAIRKRTADELIVLPALERFLEKLTPETRKQVRENIEIIKRNPQRFFDLIEHHCNFKYPYIPEIDADAALYQDGFFSREEKNEIKQFHQSVSKAQFDQIENINSPRIRILANRILSRNFRHAMTQRDDLDDICLMDRLRSDRQEDRIVGFRTDTKLNIYQALGELNEIREANDLTTERDKRIARWLKSYLSGL